MRLLIVLQRNYEGIRKVETLTFSDSGTQYTGQRSLQNHVSLYKGTDLRSQTFRYKMRAKNSDELQQIYEIIHRFKRYSAPTLNSKLRRTTDDKTSQGLLTASAEVRQSTVDVPIIWSVAERIKDRYKSRFSDAFVMFPAIITEVSTDYTPNQQWQTVANTAGDPIEVELAVTFREVIPSDAGFMEAVRAASITSINITDFIEYSKRANKICPFIFKSLPKKHVSSHSFNFAQYLFYLY